MLRAIQPWFPWGYGVLAVLVLAQPVAAQAASDLLETARRMFAAGDYAGAEDAYGRLLRLEPGNVDVWYGRAMSRYRQDKLDAALSDFTRVIDLDPADRQAITARGFVHQRRARWLDAIADYDRALAIDPDHATTRYQRASARYCAGDLDGALADYRAVGARHPKYADLSQMWNWIILSRLDRRREGRLELIAYLKNRPTDAANDRHLPLLQYLANRIDEPELMRRDNTDGLNHYVAGMKRLSRGDQEGAVEHLGEAAVTGFDSKTQGAMVARVELRNLRNVPLDLDTLAGSDPTPPSAQPGVVPWQGRIVSSRHGDIHIVEPAASGFQSDAGGISQLTRDEIRNTSPALSPDGRLIVYVSWQKQPNPKAPDNLFHETYESNYAKAALIVMNADGGNARTLVSFDPCLSPRLEHPSWSPDGRMLVFSYSEGDVAGAGPNDLYLIGADGSGLRKLTDSEDYTDLSPSWSPDGTRIVFQRIRHGSFWMDRIDQVCMIDADGRSSVQRLTQGNAPVWLPDGRRVAFVTRNGRTVFDENRSAVLGIVDTETLDAQRLGPTFFAIDRFQWSPDGGAVAVIGRDAYQPVDDGLTRGEVDRRETAYLYLMNADGTERRQVHSMRASLVPLVWSPDGEQICFATRPDWLGSDKATYRIIDHSGSREQVLGELGSVSDWGPAPGTVAATASASIAGRWKGEVRIVDQVFPIEVEISEMSGRVQVTRAIGPRVPEGVEGALDRAGEALHTSVRLEPEDSAHGRTEFYATWTLRFIGPDVLRIEERISRDQPRYDGPAFPVYDLSRAGR